MTAYRIIIKDIGIVEVETHGLVSQITWSTLFIGSSSIKMDSILSIAKRDDGQLQWIYTAYPSGVYA